MVGKSSKRSHEMVFASRKKRPKRAGKPEKRTGDGEHPTGRGRPGTSPVATDIEKVTVFFSDKKKVGVIGLRVLRRCD